VSINNMGAAHTAITDGLWQAGEVRESIVRARSRRGRPVLRRGSLPLPPGGRIGTGITQTG
jgi:hypothetical protein